MPNARPSRSSAEVARLDTEKAATGVPVPVVRRLLPARWRGRCQCHARRRASGCRNAGKAWP